jgi:serine/threonine protein kinase
MYLHSHSIIFRDLKPQNIGFDVRGDVKIFDFGMARIVPEGGNPYDDRFKMSGVGSRRLVTRHVSLV